MKGGTGKSTLARALGREAANSGLTVKIADLDVQQKTAVDWSCTRLAAKMEPFVPVEPFGTARQALAIAHQYDLLILDGPARTSAATLEIALSADLVVQPTGASADDLRPAVREFNALFAAGIPKTKLVFALNHISTAAEEAETREYIREAGFDALEGSLYERAAYRKCQNLGFAVNESLYPTLNLRVDTLIQSIIDRVTHAQAKSS